MFLRRILFIFFWLFLSTSGVYAICGDWTIDLWEQCDDGWVAPSDWCNYLCQFEWWYACISEPSSCTQCFAWAYWSGGVCSPCSANTFSSFDGSSSCDLCPAGSESPQWAFYCDPCGPWSYSEEGSSCTLCAEGSYSVDAGTDVCLLCGPWEWSDTWSTSCSECLPGTVNSLTGYICESCGTWEIAVMTWSMTCTSCSSGSEANESHTACVECSPGRYEDGGACLPCIFWFIAAWTGATECVACGENTFTSFTESTVCEQCPWWSESGTWASECMRCSPWSSAMTWSSCVECLAWRYTSLTWSTACMVCDPWTYSMTWAAVCIACAPNTFTDVSESTSCQSCPAWYTSITWAISCTACDEWTYRTWWTCVDCAVGTYTDAEASLSCTQCLAGTFASTVWTQTCTQCDPGTYSTTWATTCTLCAPWTYQNLTNAISCTTCAVWWISGTWAINCGFCSPWTYRVGEDCVPSPVWWGWWSSLSAVTNYRVTNDDEQAQTSPSTNQWTDEDDWTEATEEDQLQERNEILQVWSWELEQSSLPRSYDDELVNAYNWARENRLFGENEFDNELLYKPMTRGELAKMVSNFARRVLSVSYVFDATCTSDVFVDTKDRSDEQRDYVEQACSLHLMGRRNDTGWIIEQFRANDVVTRAEFATVISRLLYGEKNNGTAWEDRYKQHITALYDNGFLKDITAPFVDEVLGYVMIVMMRIDQKN